MQKLLILCIVIFLWACGSVPVYEQKYQEGISAWEQGNKKEAIVLLNESLADNPQYYPARMELGNYHRELQEYEQAAKDYEAAIELAAQESDPWILAGESYLQVGRSIEDPEEYQKVFLTAQYKFSKALELPKLGSENKFRATLGKGICLLKRTLTEDAREYLGKALEEQPNDIEAKFYNAVLKEQQVGPNKASMEIYEKVIAANSKHVEALKQMGDLFKKLGHTNQAHEYYSRFLNAGGKSASIQEWVIEQDKVWQAANAVPREKETIMICPDCGRIGKKGQKVCDFDGSDLIPQEKS